MAQRTARRRGRPAKPPEERKRGYLAFRARDRLRGALKERADEEGRSISEEIEHRLERSLFEDQLLGNANRLQLWARDVGAILLLLESIAGKRAFGPDGDALLFLLVRNVLEDFLGCDQPRLGGRKDDPCWYTFESTRVVGYTSTCGVSSDHICISC